VLAASARRIEALVAPRTLGVLLAVVGLLLVSTDSLITRAADVSGWTVVFWFGVFAAPATFGFLAVSSGQSPRRLAVDGGWPLLWSALFQVGSSVTFILAVKNTTIANVVVIIAAAPVFAAVAARLIIGERTRPRVWVAIAITLGGILIVMSDSLGGGRLTGDLLALAAITSFSFNLIVWRRHPELNRASAIGFAAVFMVIIGALPATILGLSATTYLLMFVMGAVAGPLGRVALASATRYLPAAEVSLFTPVETVAATVWAWLAFDETPAAATYVGGAIVIAAVLWGTAGADAEEATQ